MLLPLRVAGGEVLRANSLSTRAPVRDAKALGGSGGDRGRGLSDRGRVGRGEIEREKENEKKRNWWGLG